MKVIDFKVNNLSLFSFIIIIILKDPILNSVIVYCHFPSN